MAEEAPEESVPVMDHPMQLFKPADQALIGLRGCKIDQGHKKLEIVPETVEFLSKVKKPVVLVTIVGNQRGGKSTLLNLLHSRKTEGFGLGHYMDPQTTGLWIWMRPHPRDPDVQVLLMDTEGLDSPHIPQGYNWTLSALSLLISTYYIYQTKGSIESSATDRLGVILKVAEQIRGGNDSTGGQTDKPDFLWLIRDRQLQMKKQPRDEMVEKLEKGAVQALDRCFSKYDCVVLPRPVHNDDLLKEVDKMGWDGLNPEFKEEYVMLERSIFNSVLHPRHLSGTVITGEVMASLVSKYSTAISSSAGILTELSQLPTQRQMIAKMAGEKALKKGLEEYEKELKPWREKFPLKREALDQIHNQAFSKALKVFKEEAHIQNENEIPEDSQEYFDDFNKKVAEWENISAIFEGQCVQVRKLVGGNYFQVWNSNREQSERKTRREIENLHKPLLQKINENQFSSLDEYFNELSQFRSSVLESQGSESEELLDKYLKSRERDAQLLGDSITAKREKQLESSFKNSLEELEKRFQLSLQENSKKFEDKFDQISKKSEEKLENVQNELRKKLESNSEVSQQLSGKLSAQEQLLSASNSRLEALSNELERKSSANSTRIEEVDSNFQKKIQKNSTKLEEKLLESQSNNQKSISELQTGFSSRFESLKEENAKKLLETTQNFENSSKEVKTLLDQKLGEIQKQVDDKSEIESIRKQFSQLEEDLQKEVKAQLSSLVSQLQAIQQNASSFDSNLEALSKELKNISKESNQNLQAFSQNLEQSKESFNSFRNELETSQESKLRELEENLQSQIQNSIEELKENSKQQENEFSALKSATEEFRSSQERLESSLSSISSQNEEKQNQLQEEIISLSKSLQESNSKLEEVSSHNEESEKKFESTNSSIETLKKEQEELKEKLEQNKNNEEGDQKLTQLEEEVNNLRDQNQFSSETFKSFREQVDQVEKALATLQSKLSTSITSNLEERIKTVQMEVKENIESIQEATVQQLEAKVQDSFEEASKKVDDLRDQLSVVAGSSRKLETGIRETLKAELIKLKEASGNPENAKEMDHLKRSVDAIWDAMGVLSGKIVTVEATMDRHN